MEIPFSWHREGRRMTKGIQEPWKMELPIQLGVTCRLSLRPPLKGPQSSRPGFEGKAQQAAHQGSGCKNPLSHSMALIFSPCCSMGTHRMATRAPLGSRGSGSLIEILSGKRKTGRFKGHERSGLHGHHAEWGSPALVSTTPRHPPTRPKVKTP